MSQRTLYSVWFIFALCVVVGAQERSISGEYRNHAEGFAVRIPSGLHGVTGEQAGPERGVTISLSSGGSVIAYGEPNSLEYKSAEEGIRDSLPKYCNHGEQMISAAILGKAHGAEGKVVCGERVILEMLAFRPGGGPIYWLRLQTTNAHAATDEQVFRTIARGFKVIAWR